MPKNNRVMISQPYAGLTDFEIDEARRNAVETLEEKGFEVVDTFFSESSFKDLTEREIKHIPLYYLAKSIEYMAKCDAVYFCKGWENARGCEIEHKAAVEYGLECFYE